MINIYELGIVTRLDLARTIAGQGRYWTTAYLVDRLLIDTGCAHTAPELVATLESSPPVNIVNTHSHEDHIGGNGRLQKQDKGLRIMAHPLALPVLTDPRRQKQQPYRHLFWGVPEPSSGEALEDRAWIETDKHRFQVVYTPGHSPDHICLYEPEQGWLFTGDLFVGGKERALRVGYDILEIIASLKRVAKLPISILFPGCAKIREKPEAELQSKITYLQDFGQQVIDLHARGWEIRAIARKLCGKPMWIEMATLGHFSRRRLVLSYLGLNKDI